MGLKLLISGAGGYMYMYMYNCAEYYTHSNTNYIVLEPGQKQWIVYVHVHALYMYMYMYICVHVHVINYVW